MLKRAYRLKKNFQFSYIYKKGDTVPSKHLVLIYALQRNSIKVGFSVSNKIGKAVIRNKVKRRLRAIVSELLPMLKTGYSYIFAAKKGIEEDDFDTLFQSVKKLIEKAVLNIESGRKKQ